MGGDKNHTPTRDNKKFTLKYPKHILNPEDLLNFIELPAFTRRWAALGLDDDRDLSALQILVMLGPKRHAIIKGTPGIRKLRFAPQRWKRGKSGAARVLYVHLEKYGIVLLCLVYAKNEVETISNAVKQI
jgi:hypothetical protein